MNAIVPDWDKPFDEHDSDFRTDDLDEFECTDISESFFGRLVSANAVSEVAASALSTIEEDSLFDVVSRAVPEQVASPQVQSIALDIRKIIPRVRLSFTEGIINVTHFSDRSRTFLMYPIRLGLPTCQTLLPSPCHSSEILILDRSHRTHLCLSGPLSKIPMLGMLG